jgi:DNA-binding transcriptional LysR family regulator
MMVPDKSSKLNLLDCLLLREIRATGSLTASVALVGLSQPAISIRLAHMRRHFGDPLFVRTSEGMQPTPFLENLMPDIERAINLLNPRGGLLQPFDPRTSTRRFRLALSHVGQMVVLPELLSLLKDIAPRVQIDSVDLDGTTAQLMESGRLDLALGYSTDINTGFYQQRLFTENYLCIARAGHPLTAGRLTREQFLEARHLALVAPATGHSQLDKALEERGALRNVAVRVSSLLGIEQIIASTELLAIVPARLARSLAMNGKITAMDLPFPPLSYEVRQYWHQRYRLDAGNDWLRKLVFDTFTNLPPVFEQLVRM